MTTAAITLDIGSETPVNLVPKAPGILRVIIYARISKLRKGKDGKVRNSTNTTTQVAECMRELKYIARDRGVEVVIVAIFKEDDRSASKYSKKPRPKWERTVELIQANWADMLMGTEGERITRRPRQMNTLIDHAGVGGDLREIYFTSDDCHDLTTPDGIYRARQVIDLAERESNKLSQRTRRTQNERAEDGQSHGGRRCFGFKEGNAELDEDGPELPVLRQMGQLRIKARSHKDIAYWLNEKGYRGTEGGEFTAATVRGMLRRKRYAPHPVDPERGIREHNGAEYVARWKSVWTPDEWAKLQLIEKLGSEKYKGRPARKGLLTRYLVCGKCGMTLNRETKRDKPDRPLRPVYHCRVQGDTKRKRGCGGVTRGAEPLEDYVLSKIFEWLDTPRLGKLLDQGAEDDGRLKELLDARTLQEHRIQEILDDYADGELTREQKNRAKTRADTKLQEIDQAINQINRGHQAHMLIPVGQTVREAWAANESFSWRHELIGLVVERIIVHPGGGKPLYKGVVSDGTWKFDPSMVEIIKRELSDRVLRQVANLLRPPEEIPLPINQQANFALAA